MDKINHESALLEFERFAEAMCIDTNESKLSTEELESFSEYKDLIIKSIGNGSLVIKDSGEPVFTPQRSDNCSPITFYEPTGGDIMAQDRKGKGQDFAKFFACMGAMTHTHASVFSKMKYADLKVCKAIALLFLA